MVIKITRVSGLKLKAEIDDFEIISDQIDENSPQGPVNRYDDRYVWYVSSWIDPPSSNPRRNTYAIIDPVSGEVCGASGRYIFCRINR